MSNSLPQIRVYGVLDYDRGGKVRWLLQEMGIPYEDKRLDLENREFEQPSYLKLNPMGRVPIVEIIESGAGDQPQIIAESGGICAYLADRFADKGLAPAISAPTRGKYQQWLHFAGATLDTIQTRVMVIEDIPPGEVFDKKMPALLADLGDALVGIDRALGDDGYLVGNRFSAADICVGYHLYWCMLWPELAAVASGYPRVLKYLERLKGMPSAVKANVFSYEP